MYCSLYPCSCKDFMALKPFDEEERITGETLFQSMVEEILDDDIVKKVCSSSTKPQL